MHTAENRGFELQAQLPYKLVKTTILRTVRTSSVPRRPYSWFKEKRESKRDQKAQSIRRLQCV
jgi:hypothetical protein